GTLGKRGREPPPRSGQDLLEPITALLSNSSIKENGSGGGGTQRTSHPEILTADGSTKRGNAADRLAGPLVPARILHAAVNKVARDAGHALKSGACSRPLLLAAVETAVLECAAPRVSVTLLRHQLHLERSRNHAQQNQAQVVNGHTAVACGGLGASAGGKAAAGDGNVAGEPEHTRQQQQQQQGDVQRAAGGVPASMAGSNAREVQERGRRTGACVQRGAPEAQESVKLGQKDELAGGKSGSPEGELGAWEWGGWCRPRAWVVAGPSLIMVAMEMLDREGVMQRAHDSTEYSAAATATNGATQHKQRRSGEQHGSIQHGGLSQREEIEASNERNRINIDQRVGAAEIRDKCSGAQRAGEDRSAAPSYHPMVGEVGERLRARALQGLLLPPLDNAHHNNNTAAWDAQRERLEDPHHNNNTAAWDGQREGLHTNADQGAGHSRPLSKPNHRLDPRHAPPSSRQPLGFGCSSGNAGRPPYPNQAQVPVRRNSPQFGSGGGNVEGWQEGLQGFEEGSHQSKNMAARPGQEGMGDEPLGHGPEPTPPPEWPLELSERCALSAGAMAAAMVANDVQAARRWLLHLIWVCHTHPHALPALLPMAYAALSVWPDCLLPSLLPLGPPHHIPDTPDIGAQCGSGCRWEPTSTNPANEQCQGGRGGGSGGGGSGGVGGNGSVGGCEQNVSSLLLSQHQRLVADGAYGAAASVAQAASPAAAAAAAATAVAGEQGLGQACPLMPPAVDPLAPALCVALLHLCDLAHSSSTSTSSNIPCAPSEPPVRAPTQFPQTQHQTAYGPSIAPLQCQPTSPPPHNLIHTMQASCTPPAAEETLPAHTLPAPPPPSHISLRASPSGTLFHLSEHGAAAAAAELADLVEGLRHMARLLLVDSLGGKNGSNWEGCKADLRAKGTKTQLQQLQQQQQQQHCAEQPPLEALWHAVLHPMQPLLHLMLSKEQDGACSALPHTLLAQTLQTSPMVRGLWQCTCLSHPLTLGDRGSFDPGTPVSGVAPTMAAAAGGAGTQAGRTPAACVNGWHGKGAAGTKERGGAEPPAGGIGCAQQVLKG
ncbi:hypothetical protein DUNSADRAFT_213, partial [Dunaliella salina]